MIIGKIFFSPMWISTIYCAIAFVLGSSIGSFLNVVIYRVPRDMSVGKPRRSFCPACEKAIPWYLNIPLFSWVFLRGKCRYCGSPIAFRYFFVELITGLFFLTIWLRVTSWQAAFVYWILISLLIAATFIDLEHYIIPDGITIGGAIAGIICALWVPAIMGETTWLRGVGMSALGAVAGYGSLWCIVHLGKLAFGRVKESFEKPVPWSVTQEEGQDEPLLSLGEDSTPWSEFFFRPSDRIIFQSPRIEIAGKSSRKTFKNVSVEIYFDRIEVGEDTSRLEDLESVKGEATSAVIPREAMGFGDVKFMAMIGAFLGWQAVLFTILAGSVTGAIVGLVARITGRQGWSSKIPFGPFLALGAVIWLFYGRRIVDWYFFRTMG